MNSLIKKKRHLKCITNPHYPLILEKTKEIAARDSYPPQVKLTRVTLKAFLEYLKQNYPVCGTSSHPKVISRRNLVQKKQRTIKKPLNQNNNYNQGN